MKSKLLILGGLLSLSALVAAQTIYIKQSDIVDGKVSLIFDIEPVVCPAPVIPEPPSCPPVDNEPEQPTERKVYPEDLAVDYKQSTPLDPSYPLGMTAVLDVEYLGSFRMSSSKANGGDSSSNFARGAIGFNKDRNSLFLAGSIKEGAIAEFEIPEQFSFESNAIDIVNAKILTPYVKLLSKTSNDVINDISIVNDKLFVTSEITYEAGASNERALQILNPNNILGSDKTVYRVQGDAEAAGYISKVPSSAKPLIDYDYVIGWAANNSINSRYSHGPSLFTFEPDNIVDNMLLTKPLINYPFKKGFITERPYDTADDNPAFIWNVLSKAQYAFIVPDTTLLLVVGSNGGAHSGIIYKDDKRYPERDCGGSCSIDTQDNYNFFWLYDMEDVLRGDPMDAKPFSYGKWSHPHDDGTSNVRGAAYDSDNQILYVSLNRKGQIGKFDFPPLFNAYKITKKESN